MDAPGHADPLIITDAALNIAPTLEDKLHIVQNAIDLANLLVVPTWRRATCWPRAFRSWPGRFPRHRTWRARADHTDQRTLMARLASCAIASMVAAARRQ